MSQEDIAVDEFDTVAAWTAEVLLDMSATHTVPGACRGSGNPAALAWLAEALEVSEHTRFVDTGGGLGGPAGWLAEHYGARPVLCDPMPLAAKWGQKLFGLPSVAGSAQGLPFAPSSFDATWALGVLSTVGDKDLVLREVRRVLTPSGRFGLLEYVSAGADIVDPPSGNEFLSPEGVDRLLVEHGFVVINAVDGSRLPMAPLSWRARVDQVKAAVAHAHPDSAVIANAELQERRFADLMGDGSLTLRLTHAVVAD